jgi:hypothetical protein
MILLPPVGQFRSRYVFLTPNTYQQDFVNVLLTAETGTLVLDGVAVTAAPSPITGTDFSVLRLPLEDGPHAMTADGNFGIVVYGYGGNDDDFWDDGAANVSYGYPGGLNFLPLNPKDPQP